MADWIKCSERMPEKYTDVLIVTFNPGDILLAYLNKSNEFCYDRNNDGDEMICYATHTGNRYPSRRRSDVMDYLLLCVGAVIWVRYLC